MKMWGLRRTVGLLLASCVLLSAARQPPIPETSGLISARLADAVQAVTGAAFAPSVAPVVSVTQVSTKASLSWPRVSISGAATVGYRVMRTTTVGSVEVCSGANAPVTTGEVVTCFDETVSADASYSYTQQPILVRGGTVTWSRPPSAPSATFVGARIAFANVGTTVSTNGPAVSVPMPTGTQPGDLLLLVSVSGRQNAPSTPPGWTALASVGITGGSALRLFVAWRIADGASALTWDPNANSTGASVRIVRYVRGNGNTTTPVVATSSVTTATEVSTTTFTPSPNPVTTGANAEVVSIVAQRAAGSVSIVTGQGFVADHAELAASGGVAHAVGVGGRQMVDAGNVTLPTWGSTTGGVWAAAAVAFR